MLDGGYDSWCIGTLVASNIVLTAAHCIDGTDPSKFHVYFGPNAKDSFGSIYAVVGLPTRHPGHTGDGNHALALLELESEAATDRRPLRR